ncbi:MAG: class I SAM-dependent methyltransferase [Actinomycetota bacterium]|nr:class I SAM-dependent methyltransferase [Actinomycetota bacterium]
MAEGFRTGQGVPHANYAVHDIQAAFTRPGIRQPPHRQLAPGHARGVRGPPGGNRAGGRDRLRRGVAAVQIARDFPAVPVDGFDTDDASIANARKLAADAGVADRVRFEVRDASRAALAGAYDLVLCIETLHDVAQPVAVLRTMRRLLGPGGTVLVADKRTAEAFTTDAGEMEQLFCARSSLHACRSAWWRRGPRPARSCHRAPCDATPPKPGSPASTRWPLTIRSSASTDWSAER